MFNNDAFLKKKNDQLAFVSFYTKQNRSLLSRFYNFTFNTFHISKKKKFFFFFRKLLLDNKFFLRKNLLKKKEASYNKDRPIFSWLLYKIVTKSRYNFVKNEFGIFFSRYQLIRPRYMGYVHKAFSVYKFFLFQKKNRSVLFSLKKKKSFTKSILRLLKKKRDLIIFFNKMYLYRVNKNMSLLKNFDRGLLVKVGQNNRLCFLLRYSFFKYNMNFISPSKFLIDILYTVSNKIIPFINKSKSFVSKREVHFDSLYFFIEKNNFLYKNSYFFGLLLKKKRGAKSLVNAVFSIVSYKFSKNPYVLSSSNILI